MMPRHEVRMSMNSGNQAALNDLATQLGMRPMGLLARILTDELAFLEYQFQAMEPDDALDARKQLAIVAHSYVPERYPPLKESGPPVYK